MTIKTPPQDRNCSAGGGGLVSIMSQPAYDEKPPATALRASAEEQLASHSAGLTPAPPQALLLHELQVHQIELEIQNEELQHRQLQLEVANRRYFDLYDLAPVGYCTLNEGGAILQTNLTASTMLGIERSALVRQIFARYVLSDDRDAFYVMCKALHKGGSVMPVELRLMRQDGTYFWAQLVANASQRGDDALVLRITITDISEHQTMEAALHKSEAELKSILESTSDGILAIDNHGKVILFNQRFGQLWRLPPSMLNQPDDQTLLNHVVSQLAEPEAFARKVQALYASDFQGIDTIDFTDGRIFERFTAPIDSNAYVIGRIWSFRDVTERKHLEDQVRELAFHDALTQLPNRRLLTDRLSQALSAGKRSGNYGALMVLDLDNFKPLNDTSGHPAGDLLLIEVARRLVDCVRAIDTVARVGGDEFVVLIGELDADKVESTRQAAEVAEKIRVSLAEPYRLTLSDGAQAGQVVEHRCTASIGVVLFNDPTACQTDILKWADAAMYRAKEAGRNTVQFHTDDSTL
jgi:diguanylate cyclase (GGDEF)-like protein/PAS domain S-box-containing protein